MAGKKSVMKTVEQLLPRKFDLSLVVAVILAGILVCYLFKDVRISKVEGFTPAGCSGNATDISSTCIPHNGNENDCSGEPGCQYDSGSETCVPLVGSNEPCTGDESEEVCGALGCTWSAEEDSSCNSADECPDGRPACVGDDGAKECSATCTGDGDCPDSLQYCVDGTCSATESNNGDDSSTLDWTSASEAFRTANFQEAAQCIPIVGASPEVNCGDLSEDECGPGSSGSAISQTNCRWSDCSEVYSMTGTLEGGYFQTWMDECLFGTDFGTVEQTATAAGDAWLDTSTIPLASQGSGSSSSELTTALSNDFLKVMELADETAPTANDPKATVDAILSSVQESRKIPDNYKTVVHKKVKQCADGWLQNSSTKDAYKDRAGGRPIMGYNSKDGLKCRNSFYQTTETPTSESRLIFDSDICTGADGTSQCPCEPPSHCGWAEAVSDDGVISRTIDGISHSVGGNRSWCRVPACRSMYSASWCGPSAIYDTFADVGATAMDSLPNLGGRAGKCSS